MRYDITIVGGGIVGLATAYQLKKKKPDLEILLLEKEPNLATHQTGNNSGVIHSGLYYKPGSLKAKNCINGYRMLLDFCEQEDIPYELCGKIVVATSREELPLLKNLYERGMQNGLVKNELIRGEQLKEIEPYVNGFEAIRVPYAGIISYKQVSEKLAENFRKAGGYIHLSEPVREIRRRGSEATVLTSKGAYDTKLIVNCAGLYSDKIARMTGQDVHVKIVPFRGEYYKIREERKHLVKHLIYPVPDPNFPFLGVHFTRMVSGEVEAGPNAVMAFRREGYSKSQIHLGELAETLAWPGFQKVAFKYWKTGFGEMYRSFSKSAFTTALQKLLPDIKENDLVPGGAGVRAQACDRNGGLLDDFLILENEVAVNVCNAPSPAATSSLSIGDTVSNIVLGRFS